VKTAAVLIAIATLCLVGAWEAWWRFQHAAAGGGPTLSGQYVAQFRRLPEGSVRPYGQGVFVRYRYVPLWATSRLVFAGYCKPGTRSVVWSRLDKLTVRCVVAEGTTVQFSPPAGVILVEASGV
jgi:hypothetical protein